MQESHPGTVIWPAEAADLVRLLERFDLAWQTGSPPAIRDFLPPARSTAGAPGSPGLRELLHELVKIDLEYRWRRPVRKSTAGGDGWPARPRLEDYAARLSGLEPPARLPLELITEEYRVRCRWGDGPGHEEYGGRFPRWAEALGQALAGIDAELSAERVTAQTGGPAGSGKHKRTRLRCPHCHHACNPVIKEQLGSAWRIDCPACGDTFSIDALTVANRPARPPARRLGRYDVGDLLGAGAFGTVWRGWDRELGREVAVKLPRSSQLVGHVEKERFLREARFAAQLHHPGIVTVHDVGRQGETLFIVSELVRGVSLAEWSEGGMVAFTEVASLIAQVADALHHAHRHGVIHRDIKPSNIMLEFRSPTGDESEPGLPRPRVMDFGLALRDAGEVTMTLDGQVLGTPAYMSPEQIRNPHRVDGRSDVYSLGVILYELLTGGLPFRGASRMLLLQVLSDEPRLPRHLNDRIPRDLETICLKCLHKNPARRFRSAAALAADLRRWLMGEPIHARPSGWAERLWMWGRRNPALAVTLGLGAVALVAATKAPVAAGLAVLSAAALLLALHRTWAVGELSRTVESMKLEARTTTAALQYALERCARTRQERDAAVAAEAKARRLATQTREQALALLLRPHRQRDADSRELLVRFALEYLDGLAEAAAGDEVLQRELACCYASLGDEQTRGGIDLDAGLCSHRKSLALFTQLARSRPDNAQAQRDLSAARRRLAELERQVDS